MRKTTLLMACSAFLATGAASAQVTGTAGAQPATPGPPPPGIESAQRSSRLREQAVVPKPTLGSVVFTDPSSSLTARGAVGFLLEGGLSRFLLRERPELWLGVQTGVIYSHLGPTGSGFFGTGADNPTTAAGANLLLIPADLVLGWNLGHNARIAVHGGGNVVYRSLADSLDLGSSSTGTASAWKFFPNVGMDVDFGLSENLTLGFRPDWTLTPGNDIFSGMAVLSIGLG